MSDGLTRRQLLQGLGSAGVAGVAGYASRAEEAATGGSTSVRTAHDDDHGHEPCPVDLVLNTGYDQSADAVLGPGSSDDDWDVTGDEKNGPGSVPRDADVVGAGPWPAPFADSRWISIEPDRGSLLPAPDTRYEYTYCFCLKEGFRKPELAVRLQADDRVDEIRLNGHSLPYSGTGAFGDEPIEETYTNRRYFQAGENCLTVVVRDTHRVVTGLNLVGRMRAENADCDCGCPACDLAVEKRHEGQFAFGETGTYVIEVCNDGDGECTRAAVVEDELPDGVSLVSATGANWQTSAAGNDLTAIHPNPGGLAPGDCLPPLTVDVELAPIGQFPADQRVLRNCADLLGSDENAANDTGCDEIQCLEGESVRTGGVRDGFDTAGAEPADPSDGLVAKASGNLRAFDEGGSDAHFGHTFRDLRPTPLAGEICEAELEICLAPSGSSLDVNDNISLGIWDDTGTMIDGWTRKLGNHGGQSGLFDTQWSAASTGVHCVTLDLSELPDGDGSTTDLLGTLNAQNRLSVYVQDDTAVDFVRLRVGYCCDENERKANGSGPGADPVPPLRSTGPFDPTQR